MGFCKSFLHGCRLDPKLYSTLRVGREALVRRWPMEPVSRKLERLQITVPGSLLYCRAHTATRQAWALNVGA
ncbi:hypothetical protein BJD12_00995 [Xanthomonas vesicatoria ATCC 35937]|nr:hypothetical protein BJD12_00995 [Xanthomonas vesicatoria ATCC 35937]